jgi:NADH dehydrogenase FAD-containing subunit
MGKHLVLVGGGHAHLTTLMRIADHVNRGHEVTLISPSSFHYYSGMGPGMLSGLYQPREVRFNVRKMAEDRGAAFIEASVSRIDPETRRLFLDTGKSVGYDVASFNTGSEVPGKAVRASHARIVAVKPVVNLYKARGAILHEAGSRKLQIVVIGGGPAGVEVAANAWGLLREGGRSAQVSLIAGESMLKSFPARARALATTSLAARNIRVMEGVRVQSVMEEVVALADGSTLPYDYAFMAVGVEPSRLFRDSGLRVADDGGLLVNQFLQSVDHPQLFGGGDCISMVGHKLARVGVHAVRQNPLLQHNLTVALDGGEMKAFLPSGNHLLILNMSDGKGILCKNHWVWNGRWSFLLKDFIDKRFVRKFQVSGELTETVDES